MRYNQCLLVISQAPPPPPHHPHAPPTLIIVFLPAMILRGRLGVKLQASISLAILSYFESLMIIMMKNFNRRDSHGHRGSKRHELAHHAHSSGSHALIDSHDYTNTVTTTLGEEPLCAKRQLSCYTIRNRFLFCFKGT